MKQAGVLDVGCHSALLMVARRPAGAKLQTVSRRKVRLKLHQMLGPDGRLRDTGVRSVQQAVSEAMDASPEPPGKVFAFATSIIRDAPNRQEVIARVARATGVHLEVLPGREEARLSYVAARRWAGRGGRLLVLDIGGGTVEVAAGLDDQPHTRVSLPLGARTITRRWLPGGVARSPGHLDRVRQELREAFGEVSGLPTAHPGDRVLACSKTFAQLAKLAAHGNPNCTGQLTLPGVREALDLLAATDPAHRSKWPGISAHRAEQSLAGAVVAEALMEACQATILEVCPWSTREGLLMERLARRERSHVR